MSKKFLLFVTVFILLSITGFSQKISKPTLTPTEPTEAQNRLIKEGVSLHDQKQYDEAIKKYQIVLDENPSCDLALYEMALSYYTKKDLLKAVETALTLSKYKSKSLALGYGIIANSLDDQGQLQKAIEIYNEAIKISKSDKELEYQLSSLHFNLAITQYRLKQFKEAREAAKKSVEYDFRYPSPNYLLAVIFNGTRYKVPALLAAGRLITLELNSQRSKQAAAIFHSVMKGNVTPGKNPNEMTINLDFFAPKDEGDFGAFELILGTLMAIKTDKDKDKTENERFADAVDTVIGMLDDKKLKETFVGKTYIPFMLELKQKGYVKEFAYLVLQQTGNQEAYQWLVDNGQKTVDFINWSKTYQLPK